MFLVDVFMNMFELLWKEPREKTKNSQDHVSCRLAG